MIDALLLFLILGLNVLISIWNCYAVGSAWKDVMAVGGWFDKLLLWSGVTQSGVGFSMPILLMFTYIAHAFLTGGEKPNLTPQEGAEMMQAVFSLWYIAVIFPILGSGMVIWIHSLREAYRRRDFASFAVAGWNTYAQVSNTISAMENIGGAFSNVGELFSKAMSGKGDAKAKVFIIVCLLVIISLVAGFMIAFGLVKYFSKRTVSRLEESVGYHRQNA
jgi:hypothetical protein